MITQTQYPFSTAPQNNNGQKVALIVGGVLLIVILIAAFAFYKGKGRTKL